MQRKTFGHLLHALRQSKLDWTTGGCWTQQKLADVANLSLRTIGEIERGNKAMLDTDVLVPLADALQLSSQERHLFFTLAVPTTDNDVWCDHASVVAPWQQGGSLVASTQLPAILHGPLYEILAINRAWLQLHRLSEANVSHLTQSAPTATLLSLVFNPESPLKQILSHRWHQLARQSVRALRLFSFPYRHTPYWEALLTHMMQYPAFVHQWQEVMLATEITQEGKEFAYPHPMYGQLHYWVQTSVTSTPVGHLYLATLNALCPDTQRLFTRLANETRQMTPLCIVDWPICGYASEDRTGDV